jgi:hypothetical protein
MCPLSGESQIRELNRDEFLATMKAPMTLQPVDAPVSGVKIGNYVKACLALIDPGLTNDDANIHEVYDSADGVHFHVLIDYGVKNVYLVLVVDRERSRSSVTASWT